MFAHWHQLAVSVQFPRCTCRHSDAQQKRLLQDKHQHTWQDGIAITARGIEDGHLIEGERFGGDLVITIGETTRLRYLDARVDMACHGLCRLINRLVGEHQTHVGIDTHMCLFATIQFRIEVGREVEDAMHRLLRHQVLCLVKTIAEKCRLGIGSRIEVTDELPGGMAMAQIDNRCWHLSYHLIVVYPRIEQWIT